MSAFSVPVYRIKAIEPHPESNSLEFARVAGYRSLVRKGQFTAGDLVAYLPESAVLPVTLLQNLGMWDPVRAAGLLGGEFGNRVAAVSYKGELSRGLCVAVRTLGQPSAGRSAAGDPVHCLEITENGKAIAGFYVDEGDDVARLLGVTQYQDPAQDYTKAGEVAYCGGQLTFALDTPHLESYPDLLREGEDVLITERLPGVFTGVGLLPLKDTQSDAFGDTRNMLVFSKSMGMAGFMFRNDWRNFENLHIRATAQVRKALETKGLLPVDKPLTLLGSAVGRDGGRYPDDLEFILFAATVGYGWGPQFLGFDEVEELAGYLGIRSAPVLYRGAYQANLVEAVANGPSLVRTGEARTGAVITPAVERYEPGLGRVGLQVASTAYLLNPAAPSQAQ